MGIEDANNFRDNQHEKPSMWILLSYYCGIFSIIPILGLILGPIAVLLAMIGLWKGKVGQITSGLWIGRIGLFIGGLAFGIQCFVIYSIFFDSQM